MAKCAVLELLNSTKLISRKIWVAEKSWNFHTFELWFFYVKLNKIVTWTLEVVWNPQYLEVPKMEDHRGQDWTSFWHYYSEFFHELSDNHHNPRLLVFFLVVDSNMNSAPLDHSTHRLSNLPENEKKQKCKQIFGTTRLETLYYLHLFGFHCKQYMFCNHHKSNLLFENAEPDQHCKLDTKGVLNFHSHSKKWVLLLCSLDYICLFQGIPHRWVMELVSVKCKQTADEKL